ncbi:MAG TPA: hypothetical protein VN213_02920 [Solirubrobacteraceae bacterium]|nr:hypothetical protein [Solirubrobacteraceae bacterium]
MTRWFRHAATAFAAGVGSAAFAACLVVAPPAGAAIIEVGDTATDNAPSCPASPCQAVSRTTGFQVRVGEERDAFVIPQDGRIVAWTISLGTPDDQQREFFEENLGGPARAGITVLRTDERNFGRVVGRSGVRRLTPFFGTTAQFAIAETIPVKAGYRIALTVPTWAPALALGLGADSAWRAVRPDNDCTDTEGQAAQLTVGLLGRYRCVYRTARLTFSATLVTRPVRPQPAEPPAPTPTPEPRRRF